jgi:hypothetical protein
VVRHQEQVWTVRTVLALGLGWPLALLLSRLGQGHRSRALSFAVVLGAYLVESAAFAASMATDVLNIGLAVVWGVCIGSWASKSRIPIRESRRITRSFAFYTTLPAVSFLSVPVVGILGGWAVLDGEAGARFGIPGFLPWPLNTILGFCALVAGVAVVAKVVITTAVAGWVMRRSRNAGTAIVDRATSSGMTRGGA